MGELLAGWASCCQPPPANHRPLNHLCSAAGRGVLVQGWRGPTTLAPRGAACQAAVAAMRLCSAPIRRELQHEVLQADMVGAPVVLGG